MLNSRPLSKLSESLRNDLKKFTLEIATSVQKVKDATDGEAYATAAFNGGDRYFSSLEEVRNHYASIREEARQKGTRAMERMLDEFDSTLRVYLNLDTEIISAFQTKLDLAGLSESDLKRIAESAGDDYSAIKTVGSYGLTNGSAYGKAIAARLKDFEDTVAAVREKAEKFTSKALKADSYCIAGWHDWINERIDSVDSSLNDLQDAIAGRSGLTFADTFFGFKAAD